MMQQTFPETFPADSRTPDSSEFRSGSAKHSATQSMWSMQIRGFITVWAYSASQDRFYFRVQNNQRPYVMTAARVTDFECGFTALYLAMRNGSVVLDDVTYGSQEA
jgi:hypothetical protein